MSLDVSTIATLVLIACVIVVWLQGRTTQRENAWMRVEIDDGRRKFAELCRLLTGSMTDTFERLEEVEGRAGAADHLAREANAKADATRFTLGLPEPVAEVPGMGGEITLVVGGKG
jgi:hypothetical protein